MELTIHSNRAFQFQSTVHKPISWVSCRSELEFRSSRLTPSLYSHLGECQKVFWRFALFGIIIAMMKNVLPRVRNQGWWKTSFWGSEIGVVEICPSGWKSALLKNVLLVVGNQHCWKMSFRLSEISVVEKRPSGGQKSALFKILVSITTHIPSFVTVAYTELWIFAFLLLANQNRHEMKY